MRKRLLKTALLVMAICAVFVVSAYADSGIVTASDVNLRSGPGMNYEVMDCLPNGAEVNVIDMSNSDWYGIYYGEEYGFMSSKYINVNSSAPQQSQASTTEATVNAMYVRFRSGASTDSAILGEYNTGTVVTVTGTSGEWTAVIINGQSGYIYSAYITQGASQPTPQPTPEPSPAPAAYSVSASSSTPGTICGDYVRFRSGPGTDNDILGTYNRGTELTITGTSGDWTQVTIAGVSGFVFSQYVSANTQSSPVPTPAPAPAETSVPGYIKGNNVRFRYGPGTGYGIIAEYNYGKALTINGYNGDWVSVVIDGQDGYVCSSYVAEGEITVPQSNNSDLGSQIAAFALQFEGYNYCWGGTSPETGFDCSGLVYYTYANFGYSLYRVADDIAKNNGIVVEGELKPGDILCFYSGDNYVGHVGIYIGDGWFVHASSSTTGVIRTQLSGNYTDRGYIAKRIV